MTWLEQNGVIVLRNVKEPKEFKVELFTALVRMEIQLWASWRMNQSVMLIASKTLIFNLGWAITNIKNQKPESIMIQIIFHNFLRIKFQFKQPPFFSNCNKIILKSAAVAVQMDFYPKKYLPYSREQKHVLLFRKSEILLLKVSITNMPHVFNRDFKKQNFWFPE